MIIGGLEKFTTLDYPGYLAAIIFTQGCNFRCSFCYNPMLVWPASVGKANYIKQEDRSLSEDDLFVFLKSRVGELEAVVITGGEPTLHADLPEFIKKIRSLGYLIKLDTNGTNPDMLKKLLDLKILDYIAMDLKAPKEKYELTTNVKIDWLKIEESISLIMNSGVDYEFRTTAVPGLLEVADIEKMGELIFGASKWFLQKFKSDVKLIDKSIENKQAFSDKEMNSMKNLAEIKVKYCEVR